MGMGVGGAGVDAPLGVPLSSNRGDPEAEPVVPVMALRALRHSCVPLASKAKPCEP
jgi:hypothetical protein